MIVEPWEGDEAEWDRVVAESVNGTFLHTRRYLGYHGERFVDASLLVRDERGRAVGALPAALDPDDPGRVVSHPGLTYGGLVHDGSLRGEQLVATLRTAAELWSDRGCTALRYKAVPSIYHRVPSEDDRWALRRLKAEHVRCDLSTTVNLSGEAPRMGHDRRRNFKKAEQMGLQVRTGAEYLPAFWPILTANLQERFGVQPVHSVDEMQLLARLFPDQIRCDLVVLEEEPVGGVLAYIAGPVWHPQYSAASSKGRRVFALDAAFQHEIQAARGAGASWYDFGISTEEGGQVLNESLYRFKTSFGGGGVTYDHYELRLP